MTQEAHYEALAHWAEMDMEPEDAATVLTGEAAVREGREMLARAGAGRPKISPSTPKGERSPRRQVRMSQELSDGIDALAAERGESPADVMREALAVYLNQHHSAAARSTVATP